MFTIHKTDTGAVPPWEYHEAAAGEYKVGTFLRVNAGVLTTSSEGTVTRYLCMANKTNAEGDLLPVIRVNRTMILKTDDFSDLEEGVVTGDSADVNIIGSGICADGMGVSVEIISLDDDAAYVRVT